MTLQELKDWIKSAVRVDTERCDCDSSGNDWNSRIYEKDGLLYRIEFCNEHPLAKWGDRGYIHGEYDEPVKVTRKTQIIEQVYYESEEEEQEEKNRGLDNLIDELETDEKFY